MVFCHRSSRVAHNANITHGVKKMHLFDHLRPFVYFSQLFGLIPFHIENENSSKKRFKKFSFSLRHPVCWWFLLLFIIQLVITVWDIRSVLGFISETSLPPLSIGFILQDQIFLILLAVMARYVICKYACIGRAIFLLRKVGIELATEELPPGLVSALKTRVIVGISSSVILTIVTLVSNFGVLTAKIQREGTILAVIILINRSFTVMMLMSSFLLIYLCYYIVACHVRLLVLDMKRPFRLSSVEKVSGVPAKSIAWMQINDTKAVLSWKYQLKQSKKLFGDLCRALTELNKVFSLPSLVFLTLRIISSAFSLYFIIFGTLRSSQKIIQALALARAVNFTADFLSILIFLGATETPVTEFKHLRQRIFTILNEEIDIQMDDEFEALSFLQHISEGRSRLSAAGLFYVGLSLLPSLTASVITYLIILLQTRLD